MTNKNLPHTLPSLQREALELYGYTAGRTFDIATSLYEACLISFPRTDCPYLPIRLYEQAQEMARSINAARGRKQLNEKLKSEAWDDSKVTGHHGIVPLPGAAVVLEAISGSDEKMNVCKLIFNRFERLFAQDGPWEAIPARAYGDCDCACHRDPSVTHHTRCCTLD